MNKITFLNKPDPVLLGRFCDAVEQWKADQEFAAYKAKQAELEAEEISATVEECPIEALVVNEVSS